MILSQTVIILENQYKRSLSYQNILSSIEKLIIIGHAQSELKLLKMLKEFLPDYIIINGELISFEFLLKLYPIIGNSETKLIIIVESFKDEQNLIKLFEKIPEKLKIKFIIKKENEDEKIFSDKLINTFMEFGKKNIFSIKKPPKSNIPAEKLIIIGSSAGGPRVLVNLIHQYPEYVPAGIIIVQHIPQNFSKTLVETIAQKTPKNVKEANESEPIFENNIYIAKGDYHLEIIDIDNYKCLHLNRGPKIWSVRPAIDITMKSAVKHFKSKIIGIILTGIGTDGTEGIKEIKKAGGITIAQDEETSMIFGMPKNAIESGYIDYILPHYKIADVSYNLLKKL